MTSRAGNVDMGSMALTVAAIDKLNATIFPPEQLRALEQTGLAPVDFVLPGIDGTFTASAGSSPGDRWLDIRRRRTAAPAGVRPAAVAVAAPPAADGFADPFSDRADLADLKFPSRSADADFTSLTVPEDIFERPARGAQTDLPRADRARRHFREIGVHRAHRILGRGPASRPAHRKSSSRDVRAFDWATGNRRAGCSASRCRSLSASWPRCWWRATSAPSRFLPPAGPRCRRRCLRHARRRRPLPQAHRRHRRRRNSRQPVRWCRRPPHLARRRRRACRPRRRNPARRPRRARQPRRRNPARRHRRACRPRRRDPARRHRRACRPRRRSGQKNRRVAASRFKWRRFIRETKPIGWSRGWWARAILHISFAEKARRQTSTVSASAPSPVASRPKRSRRSSKAAKASSPGSRRRLLSPRPGPPKCRRQRSSRPAGNATVPH